MKDVFAVLGDTPKAKQNRRKRLQGVSGGGELWKHSTLADIEGVPLTREENVTDVSPLRLSQKPVDRMVS